MKFKLVSHFQLMLMNLKRQFTLLVSNHLVELQSQLWYLLRSRILRQVYLITLVIDCSHQYLHLSLKLYFHKDCKCVLVFLSLIDMMAKFQSEVVRIKSCWTEQMVHLPMLVIPYYMMPTLEWQTMT